MLSSSGMKVAEVFSIICNLAVTTHKTISYSRAIFFSSESLNRNSVLSLHVHLKTIFSLQYAIL